MSTGSESSKDSAARIHRILEKRERDSAAANGTDDRLKKLQKSSDEQNKDKSSKELIPKLKPVNEIERKEKFTPIFGGDEYIGFVESQELYNILYDVFHGNIINVQSAKNMLYNLTPELSTQILTEFKTGRGSFGSTPEKRMEIIREVYNKHMNYITSLNVQIPTVKIGKELEEQLRELKKQYVAKKLEFDKLSIPKELFSKTNSKDILSK